MSRHGGPLIAWLACRTTLCINPKALMLQQPVQLRCARQGCLTDAVDPAAMVREAWQPDCTHAESWKCLLVQLYRGPAHVMLL